jgi:lauroyl/myristoyl acyltransferase
MMLFTGGLTGVQLAKKAGVIVAQLADAALSNEEKRATAIAQLYAAFPMVSKAVPKPLMGKLVEIMWQQVIKPALK